MEILSVDMIRREPGERVFRHGWIAPLVMWGLFLLPLPIALGLRAELGEVLRSLSWPAWILVAPVTLLGAGLWLVCLHALGQVAYRALLPSNWLVRVSPAGLYVKLRSYQNAHFANDGPTVVHLSWSEIACARRTIERSTRRGSGGEQVLERKSWVELELAGVDTSELERLVADERVRPGEESSFLGVRTRGRSHHVPAFVDQSGRLRIDWIGGAALEALGQHVSLAETRTVDLDRQGGDLEARLRALLARGNRMNALDLARRELGLSTQAARARLEELERRAA